MSTEQESHRELCFVGHKIRLLLCISGLNSLDGPIACETSERCVLNRMFSEAH